MDNLITCLECNKKFKRISTTHLKHSHNMTFGDYFDKHPTAKIESDDVTNMRKQTLDNMIRRYGFELGTSKWEEYRQKQSISNTFEYKNEKYGMTYDEFVKYNKSRANHGEKNGNYGKGYYSIWVERYGDVIANEMNAELSKYKDSKSLKFFAKKYGESEGLKKYDEFCASQSERALNLILKNDGKVIYNPKSIPIIEQYGRENGYSFKHAENGGEERILTYYVDGIDFENKVIIEFYEPVHHSTVNKDKHRVRRILQELGPGWKLIEYWYNNKIVINEN